MGKFKKLLAVVPVIASLLMLATPAARADQIFSLTQNSCTGGCTVFGTVTLTQVGTTADVTVDLNSPYEFTKTGAGDFEAFKFNATGVALSDITITSTVPNQTLAAQAGNFNGSYTGLFSFGIACTTCGNGMSDAFSNDITFQIANATIGDLTNTNNNGFIFAASVGNPFPGNFSGPVAALPDLGPQGVLTPVPEPATIWLLGSALVGLGLVRKKAAARVKTNKR